MPYVLGNRNTKFYCVQTTKGLSLTTDLGQASRWITRTRAQNFLKTARQCKELKNKHLSVIRINDNGNEAPTIASDITEIEASEVICQMDEIYDSLLGLALRKEALTEQLKTIDKEIIDIEHAAEFYTLNAADGYKLYKLLHETRLRRRAIKDELFTIDTINSKGFSPDFIEGVVSQIKQYAGAKRSYAPRELPQLFNNSIMKGSGTNGVSK